MAGRDGGSVPLRRDARPAHRDRRHQARHGTRPPDGSPDLCGDVGFGKTEVAIRAAFKAIQDGKQVAVLAPTTLLATQHGNTFADRFSGFPIRVEVLSRFLTNAQAKKVIEGLPLRRGRLCHRHPPAAHQRRQVQGSRAARRRRGAAIRRAAQGDDEEDEDQRRRPHAVGHADPAHAGDVARRHPRPVAAADPTGGPPADPDLRRRVRRAGRDRGDPPRATPRGPGVLGAQPGAVDRHGGDADCASSSPRHASPSPTARWTRVSWKPSCRTSGTATTTCWCAPRSSSRASTCRR